MRLAVTFILVIPFAFFGQIPLKFKTLEFLELDKSKLADIKKIMGKPGREYKHKFDDPGISYENVLEYQDKQLTLRFDRKTNDLLAIDLGSPTSIEVIPTINTGITDSSHVISVFGKPSQRIWEDNLYVFSYFDKQMNRYSFSFNSEAILQRIVASAKKYNERLIISR